MVQNSTSAVERELFQTDTESGNVNENDNRNTKDRTANMHVAGI
jgi:hypothetical protein